MISSHHIPTVLLNKGEIHINETQSVFGSSLFADKVNLKTLAILQCLSYRVNVLFTDIDILFLKDPLPFIPKNYDMVVQVDFYTPFKEINTGFMYVRPTQLSVECLLYSWYFYKTFHIRQQVAINEAIEQFKSKGIRVYELKFSQFMNGEDFFTYNHYYYQNQFTCI